MIAEKIAAWTDPWQVLENLNRRIYKRCIEERIEIPCTSHDLCIKQMPDQAPTSKNAVLVELNA